MTGLVNVRPDEREDNDKDNGATGPEVGESDSNEYCEASDGGGILYEGRKDPLWRLAVLKSSPKSRTCVILGHHSQDSTPRSCYPYSCPPLPYTFLNMCPSVCLFCPGDAGHASHRLTLIGA